MKETTKKALLTFLNPPRFADKLLYYVLFVIAGTLLAALVHADSTNWILTDKLLKVFMIGVTAFYLMHSYIKTSNSYFIISKILVLLGAVSNPRLIFISVPVTIILVTFQIVGYDNLGRLIKWKSS